MQKKPLFFQSANLPSFRGSKLTQSSLKRIQQLKKKHFKPLTTRYRQPINQSSSLRSNSHTFNTFKSINLSKYKSKYPTPHFTHHSSMSLAIQSNNHNKKHQQIKEIQKYSSQNLGNRMNEYLNAILNESTVQFTKKLIQLQKQQQYAQIKSRKYASHNHYYILMKSSLKHKSPKLNDSQQYY